MTTSDSYFFLFLLTFLGGCSSSKEKIAFEDYLGQPLSSLARDLVVTDTVYRTDMCHPKGIEFVCPQDEPARVVVVPDYDGLYFSKKVLFLEGMTPKERDSLFNSKIRQIVLYKNNGHTISYDIENTSFENQAAWKPLVGKKAAEVLETLGLRLGYPNNVSKFYRIDDGSRQTLNCKYGYNCYEIILVSDMEMRNREKIMASPQLSDSLYEAFLKSNIKEIVILTPGARTYAYH